MNWNWRRLVASAGMFTPTGLVLRAGLLAVAYGVAHWGGLRDYTSILSGTAPGGDPRDLLAVALGVAYVGLHFAFVLVAPILLLAAGWLAVIHKLFTTKKSL